ncbi:MAG TPA: serine hydrolase [Acidimicrobiales bacterium]|nr:serine hydrolase [Acidimicrobiales bacterium]
MPGLPPLPPPPDDVPWPTDEWPRGEVPDGVDLDGLLDRAFDPDPHNPLARTFAVVVVHRGRLVAERYADALEHLDAPPEPVGPTTPLLSWSMAKSFLHALVGMLVADGRLDPDAPADVPLWRETDDDPRRAITLRHLLEMRDGLDFLEDYVDGERSDVINMLWGAGQADVARFAADRAWRAEPGERFNYSSGTTTVVSGIVARLLGAGEPYETFLQEQLFDAIGMTSAHATFDDAGTFIASSFVYATARDFARFGLLYLRDGAWDGRRLLPPGWVDTARTQQATDAENGNGYGWQWWVRADDPAGTFWAHGYEGQSIVVCPAADLVLVRLGKTPAERGLLLRDWRHEVVDAFAKITA